MGQGNDSVDHRHDVHCLCIPDILYDDNDELLLMHYSRVNHAKYECNLYKDGVLVREVEVTRRDR